ncbi:MAG TPA: hypothetical protein PKC87_00145 [Candidatus Absconditabacterales bacterium]|nr:hypothetical protein [Candidatus Absconditabacterales bacterium]
MEKTGMTVRLEYDFITHSVCEVRIKGTWYRTTPREFRSFDGERKLTLPHRQPRQGKLSEFMVGGPLIMITTMYNGPVYRYCTNEIIPRQNTETIIRGIQSKRTV